MVEVRRRRKGGESTKEKADVEQLIVTKKLVESNCRVKVQKEGESTKKQSQS